MWIIKVPWSIIIVVLCVICHVSCTKQCPAGSTYRERYDLCVGLGTNAAIEDAMSSCPPAVSINGIERFWDGSVEIWSSLRRAYDDGPFLRWTSGETMGNPIVAKWNLSAIKERTSDLCASYDPKTKLYTPRSCMNDTFPALCVFESYKPRSDIFCKDVQPLKYGLCVKLFSLEAKVDWMEAANICAINNGILIQRAYAFLPIIDELYGIIKAPLGVKILSNSTFAWATGSNDGHAISPAELNFPIKYQVSSDFVAVVNVDNKEWYMVPKNDTFSHVICEFNSLEIKDQSVTMEPRDKSSIAIKVSPFNELSKLQCFSDAKAIYPSAIKINAKNDFGQFTADIIGDGYYFCYLTVSGFSLPKAFARALVQTIDKRKSQNFTTLSILLESHLEMAPITYTRYLEKEINVCLPEFKTHIETKICPVLLRHTQEESKCSLKRIFNKGTMLFHVFTTRDFYSMLYKIDKKLDILWVRDTNNCTDKPNLKYPVGEPDKSIQVKDNCSEKTVVCNGNYIEGYNWVVTQEKDTCATLQKSQPSKFKESDDSFANRKREILDFMKSTSSNSSTLKIATRMMSDVMHVAKSMPSEVLRRFESFTSAVDLEESNEITVQTPNIALLVARVNQDSVANASSISLLFSPSMNRSSKNFGKLSWSAGADKSFDSNFLRAKLPVEAAIGRKVACAVFKASHKLRDFGHGDRINSHVISISTEGLSKLPDRQYLELYLKPIEGLSRHQAKVCSYWSLDENRWSSEGCKLQQSTDSNFDICRCDHMTHFAEVISSIQFAVDERQLLEEISLVSCVLSLIGLACIFLTGLAFKGWRQEPGHKLLLHFSIAVTLQQSIFLFVALDSKRKSPSTCIAIGVALHYSVLAVFFWMLTSAYLQFLRLVVVFAESKLRFVLRNAVFFSWGVPVVPIVAVLAVDHNLYTSTSNDVSNPGFCYLKDLSFQLAVVLPVAIIVLINLFIFLTILKNLWLSKGGPTDELRKASTSEKKKHLMRKGSVSVFLFFLFGITWIFGLFANIPWFVYVFCIVGPLQGFILFIFFVVLDFKTRSLWVRALKMKGKKDKTQETRVWKTTSSSYKSSTNNEMNLGEANLQSDSNNCDTRSTFLTNTSKT